MLVEPGNGADWRSQPRPLQEFFLASDRLKLPRDAIVKPERRSDLFGGIVTLTADATRLQDDGWQSTFYRNDPPAETPATLTALPYYLWANRGAGSMLVWVPES